MKLHELTETFLDLFNQFDLINEWEPDTNTDGVPFDDDGNIIANVDAYRNEMLTAWFDTLEGIEGEFDEKVESIAVYIKQLAAEAKALKAEKAAIAKRQLQKEKSVENLKAYLLNSMEALGRKKIDMPKAMISVKSNAPSLVVDDEIGFIKWAQENNDELLKYSMPEIRKNDVKALCKSGEAVPFVHMEKKVSLTIK